MMLAENDCNEELCGRAFGRWPCMDIVSNFFKKGQAHHCSGQRSTGVWSTSIGSPIPIGGAGFCRDERSLVLGFGDSLTRLLFQESLFNHCIGRCSQGIRHRFVNDVHICSPWSTHGYPEISNKKQCKHVKKIIAVFGASRCFLPSLLIRQTSLLVDCNYQPTIVRTSLCLAAWLCWEIEMSS